MKTINTITFAAMFGVLAFSANAQIIIPSTTVTFAGQSGGTTVPFNLSITFEVTENAGLYTYSYDLVTTPGEPLHSFTIGGNPNPVDTASAIITDYGEADPILSGVTGNSIIFGWDTSPAVTSDDVAFTSVNGPSFATFVANDDDIVWTSPPLIPAPVPEASTALAGAMMVLPLGVGALRAFRKNRTAK